VDLICATLDDAPLALVALLAWTRPPLVEAGAAPPPRAGVVPLRLLFLPDPPPSAWPRPPTRVDAAGGPCGGGSPPLPRVLNLRPSAAAEGGTSFLLCHSTLTLSPCCAPSSASLLFSRSGSESGGGAALITAFTSELQKDRAEREEERTADQKRRHDERAAVVVVDMTPSGAVGTVSGNAPQMFMNMMDALGLAYPEKAAGKKRKSRNANISWAWPRSGKGQGGDKAKEATSYGPVVEYLKDTWSLHAYNVANGNDCDNGELIRVPLFTMRSKVVSLVKEFVSCRGTVHGNTDLIVTTEVLNGRHLVHHVRFAIEIKIVSALTSDKGKSGYSREAITQLIGLNMSNNHRSVPVILTDITSTHSVYFFTMQSTDPLKYKIHEQECETFGSAIEFALKMSVDKPQLMIHLGRPTTPPEFGGITEDVEMNSDSGNKFDSEEEGLQVGEKDGE